MPKRPTLNDNTFLAHLFAPKKHAQPTGLRKIALSGSKNRSVKRLRSFNKMSAVQQATLTRAGLREQYLRGETTLAEARRSLRPQAISLGVARPVRTRQAPSFVIRTKLDQQ